MLLSILSFALAAESVRNFDLGELPDSQLTVTAAGKTRRHWTASPFDNATGFGVGMAPAALRDMHPQPSVRLTTAEKTTGTELNLLLPTDGGGLTFNLGVNWRLKVKGGAVGATAGIRAESDSDFLTPVAGDASIVLGLAVPFALWVQPFPQLALQVGGEWRAAFLGGGGGRPMARVGAELMLWNPVFLGGTWEYQADPTGKDQNVWLESVDPTGLMEGKNSFSAHIGVRL